MKLKYQKAILWSLIVNVALVVVELVLAPLHAQGRFQGVLGYVDGAAHIAALPGYTGSEMVGLRPRHHWTWEGFGCQVAINFVFYVVICLVVTRMRARFAPPVKPVEQPLNAGRRSLLLTTGRSVASLGAGVAAYSFFAESRWFEINTRSITIKGLPPGLDGLRIVQLSDIHHGPWMSLKWVRQIVDVSNSLNPDLVALTGDYVYRGLEYTQPVAHALSKLRSTIGVLGVMGNHDWWENGKLAQYAFAKEGVQLIDNTRRFITPDRKLVEKTGEGLCIAGVGDLWEDKCFYGDALGGISPAIPRILLSHNPDVAEEPDLLQSGYRVDLMLSGHTHGGQIRIPGVGAPVTNSRFGQKYAMGLVNGPVCPVLVNKGLGMTVMPVRFGARPEIILITLNAG